MGRKLLLTQVDRQCSSGKQARKLKMSEKQLLQWPTLLFATFRMSFSFQGPENAGLSFVEGVLRGQRCLNISSLPVENVVLSDGLSGQDVNPQHENLPTTLEIWAVLLHIVVC